MEFEPTEAAGKARALVDALKVKVVGQETVLEQIVIAVIAGGHVLLEGVPGLGKTLIATTLAHAIRGRFSRVQFTPDLMPADIIGTTVYRAETGDFAVRRGPVFCDVLLADEINRSPAKTQSALLEAMQERSVSIDGEPLPLGPGFFCMATQNPIEMEGTYPLPESQLDRFLIKVEIDYPQEGEELALLDAFRSGYSPNDMSAVPQVLEVAELDAIRASLARMVVDDSVLAYLNAIVRATRTQNGVAVGASPRATVALFLASRASALLAGRDYVTPDDVRDMATPVLRHRIILTPEAEIEGARPDGILEGILDSTEVPR